MQVGGKHISSFSASAPPDAVLGSVPDNFLRIFFPRKHTVAESDGVINGVKKGPPINGRKINGSNWGL